mmetsp:Transcript_9595/g.22408  ORF Transcript_9595/g.22408 Transcript_9595/m.22408 type:complete len:185 (-) Transcript_9595:110-664(-)
MIQFDCLRLGHPRSHKTNMAVTHSHPVNHSDTCCFVLFLSLVALVVISSKGMPFYVVFVLFVLSYWFSCAIHCALTRELQVNGYSMYPTLVPGCLIRLVRYEWYRCFFSLKVGDVVLFFPDEKTKEFGGYDQNDDVLFVKRITGIDENGMLFVEGDARRGRKHYSFDSNDFGTVPSNSVIGVWI